MDLNTFDKRQHFISNEKKDNEVYPNISFETQEEEHHPEESAAETLASKQDEDNKNKREIQNDEGNGIPKEHIEKIHPDQVSVDNKEIDEETVNKMGSMDGVRYKTKDVAAILNISEQTIRNNAAAFDEFLSIEKTPTGHRRYTKEDIEKLRLIFQLKTEKGFTNEQAMEYLKSDHNDYTTLSPEKKIDLLLLMISKKMEETADAIVQSNQQRIEQNNEMYNQNLAENTELIKKLSKQLEEKDSSIATLQDDKNTLMQQNEEFQKQIEQLKTQTEQNHDELLKELELIKQTSERTKKKWQFWK